MNAAGDDARDDEELDYTILVHLGIALSAERNHARLMERILMGAKVLSRADGGTLYLRDGDLLRFAIVQNDTLGIMQGGTRPGPSFEPLPLHRDGQPNHHNVATHAALTGTAVAIDDAYDSGPFDFSGTRAFDAANGYRSKSFLTVPLKDSHGQVAGVLQLINAFDRSGEVVPFRLSVQPLIESLASQAAVALENFHLLQAQKDLLDSFIKVIAAAIDAKSPYTSGHCQRVPVLTEMLTRAAAAQSAGPLAAFQLDEDGWYELHIASWLHDCGKVVTPEHVIDKSTKLETIHDRIHMITARFAAAKNQAEADFWRAVAEGGDRVPLRAALDARLAQLDEDRRFLEEINIGGEFMAADKVDRLHHIASQPWRNAVGVEGPLLTENEVYNLSVARGTLTLEERDIINGHMAITIRMLEQLPFPSNMRHVVEYAGGHHEKMDGTGYPKGLTRAQMSIPARIMAIADIFEALTAVDRPYKKGKLLSETVDIMYRMKKANHIDPDLFDLFLTSGVYRQYADSYMNPDQIDHVDIGRYVGA